MADKKKVVTVPSKNVDLRPRSFYANGFDKRFELVFAATSGETVVRVYENIDGGTQHFNELVTKDVGTLLGLGAKGLTIGKLLQDLAIAIAVERGDENAIDWVDDV